MIKKAIRSLKLVKRVFSDYYFNNINNFTFNYQNVKLESKPTIAGKVFVSNRGNLIIGSGLQANSGKNRNPIGGDTILRLICLKNAELNIGNNVSISNSTIVAKHKVTIEDNVMIGGSCRIWDTDFHSLDYRIRGTEHDIAINKAILIKKNAFIGGGTLILKGVTIGENSIVAAGSVASKSIPNDEIWGGNPAKFIRKL